MEQNEVLDPNLKASNSTAITYGVITGVAVVAWTIILYVGGVELFVGPLTYVSMLIPIVIAVIGGLKVKKIQGGYLSFKEALKAVFIIFIVFIVIDAVFNYILLSVIDVPFREAVMQHAAVNMEKMMVKMGATQETIDKAIEGMNDPKNYSFSRILLSVLFRFVGWFIVALIIAAIIKKKRPEFENQF